MCDSALDLDVNLLFIIDILNKHQGIGNTSMY